MALSTDAEPALARFAEESGVTFPLLIDPGGGIVREWGVLNESSEELPHPTVVVIGADGIVRYRWTDPNYRTRPSPDVLLEALPES